jgi:phosphatidylglycerophosphate synthase
MVVVVVARELAITGLRLLAASKNVLLAAEGYGKHKTITQMVAIIAIFIFHGCGEWGAAGNIFSWVIAGKPWVQWFAEISTWLAVVLTIISGAVYLWRNRALYLSDM